jgi:hypothetical protein
MKHLLSLPMLLLAVATVAGAAEPTPWIVPGLELPAPQKTKDPGYLKVKVRCTGTIAWDVEAQFDSDKAVFQWEPLDEKTILVSIPAASGVIRVTAIAVVDGKLTGYAKTLIETEGPASATVTQPPALPTPPGPPPPGPGGSVGAAYFILDVDRGDPGTAALVTGSPLRDGLRALGVKPWVFSASGKAIDARGLRQALTTAGGVPALVLTDQAGTRVLFAGRVPPTAQAILDLVRHGGK